MIFEKHSVHLNRLESFYLMPFASYLPTQIISELKYYSYSSLVNKKTEQLADGTEEITPSFLTPKIYTVAAITVANGSDDISIYIPLFSSTQLENFLIIIGLFFLLLAIWCYAAYQLTHQQTIADFLTKYGNYPAWSKLNGSL